MWVPVAALAGLPASCCTLTFYFYFTAQNRQRNFISFHLFCIRQQGPYYTLLYFTFTFTSCWTIPWLLTGSGSATPGRTRSNDMAGRSTALALPCLLLCFGNSVNRKLKCWLLYLFYFDSKTWNNQRCWRPVFWGRLLKKVVNFFEEQSASGDLDWGFSHLKKTWPYDLSDMEMTWLPWRPGVS